MLETITLTGGIWIVLGALFAMYIGQVVKLGEARRPPIDDPDDDAAAEAAESTVNRDGEPPVIDYTRDGWEDDYYR